MSLPNQDNYQTKIDLKIFIRIFEDAITQQNSKYLSSNKNLAQKILDLLKQIKARNDNHHDSSLTN